MRPTSDHHHTQIGLHTPTDVHYGHAITVAERRSATPASAHAVHPERFATIGGPKIVALPTDAWINCPATAELEAT